MASIKVYDGAGEFDKEYPDADSYQVTERGYLILEKGSEPVAVYNIGAWSKIQLLPEPEG